LERQLTPQEAFDHLRRVIENVNAVTQSLVTSEVLQRSHVPTEDNSESAADAEGDASLYCEEDNVLEKQWEFDPSRGNVVFASALDCWGFTLNRYAVA
jgi:ribosome assembly protein 1